jgi:regulatory protein
VERDGLEEVREAGLRLLARREHSAKELRQKLMTRGHPPELIDAALAELAQERLLSEERFAEEFIRARRERGFGPLKIRAELRERGIDDSLADAYLRSPEQDWQARALAQYHKRFGEQPPRDMAERGKRYRFLSSRGFTPEQIRRVLEGNS